MNVPTGTPAHLAELGALYQIKTTLETFNFDPRDNYILCADTAKRLHIAFATKERFEANADMGEVKEITYFVVKVHLDNTPTEYFHKFEPKRPQLVTDGEGLLCFAGGTYRITAAGIEG